VKDVRGMRWILGALLIAGVAVVLIARAGSSDDPAGATEAEPASVRVGKGSDAGEVTLSADAARRLGIRTAPVIPRGPRGEAIPYDAVLYDPSGQTFTYTSPKPLVFVRHPIEVRRIHGPQAFLSSGPPVGTKVVTVGSQELFGVEYEVEED